MAAARGKKESDQKGAAADLLPSVSDRIGEPQHLQIVSNWSRIPRPILVSLVMALVSFAWSCRYQEPLRGDGVALSFSVVEISILALSGSFIRPRSASGGHAEDEQLPLRAVLGGNSFIFRLITFCNQYFEIVKELGKAVDDFLFTVFAWVTTSRLCLDW